jgi:hypothetical protein
MRWATGVFALAAAAPSLSGPPPSSLTHRTFYRAEQLAKLAEAVFDPEDWVNGEPSEIVFEDAGTVRLEWGQDGTTCTLTSTPLSDAGTDYALEARCADQRPWEVEAEWSWTGAHRALTNLLDVGPHDTSAPPRVEVAERSSGQEVDPRVLTARFERRYAAAQLPALAGSYREPRGSVLAIHDDGAVTLDGKPFAAVIRRCWGTKPGSATACLLWGGTNLLRAERTAEGLVFEEGRVAAEIGYYPFEAKPGGRRFTRQR